MPTLSKNVSHEYDPGIVFHSHSANIPLLHSWIDDLVQLTESSLPAETNPTTDSLVQSLQRYDAIFRELLRQMSIFSEPLTRMTAKSWAGVLKLLDYTIKSYHRYVKHTTHLQTHAQQLLNERQAQTAAAKVKEEEFELERTALRAKIRVIEAENEALRASNRVIERENAKLRSTITMYINSEDLSKEMWDLFREFNSADSSNNNNDDESQEQQKAALATLVGNRQQSVDISRTHLRNLNRLDIEMSEVLSQILKEEDRQRHLVKELMRLMERNKDVFGPGKRTGERYVAGDIRVIETAETAIQVDEKDTYGVVDDLIESPREETIVAPPNCASNLKVKGHEVPYPLRKLMKSFPNVLRIPPVTWTCQIIMAIYFSKTRLDAECERRGELKMPMPEFVFHFFSETLGQQQAADNQICLFLKACEYHNSTARRIALFSSQMGLFDKNASANMDVRDTEYILSVLETLERHNELAQRSHHSHGHNHSHNHSHSHSNSHGHSHNNNHNNHNNNNHNNNNSNISEDKSILSNVNQPTFAVAIRPEILRSVAVSTVEEILKRWLPDGGQDFIIKVKSMPGVERSTKYVNIDEFLEIMMEPWTTIRLTWEDHARFLFQSHSLMYRLLMEAQYANDQGARDRDAVVAQIQRLQPNECYRRPLRFFQFKSDFNTQALASGNEDGKEGRKGGGPLAVQKEAVVELMSKKHFMTAIRVVLPTISNDEAEKFYRECCEYSNAAVVRCLETIWLRLNDDGTNTIQSASTAMALKGQLDDDYWNTTAVVRKPTYRDFYLNLKTGLTQWARPYHIRTYCSQDIEVEAFVAILLHRNVFAKSPHVEMMHLAPKDLWPNADVLYKQYLHAQEKAERLRLEHDAKLLASQQPVVSMESTASVEDKVVEDDPSPRKSTSRKSMKKSKSSGTKRQSLRKKPSTPNNNNNSNNNSNSRRPGTGKSEDLDHIQEDEDTMNDDEFEDTEDEHSQSRPPTRPGTSSRPSTSHA